MSAHSPTCHRQRCLCVSTDRRASVRSVLARCLRPRSRALSAGSARWASAPTRFSSSTTKRHPVHPSKAKATSPRPSKRSSHDRTWQCFPSDDPARNVPSTPCGSPPPASPSDQPRRRWRPGRGRCACGPPGPTFRGRSVSRSATNRPGAWPGPSRSGRPRRISTPFSAAPLTGPRRTLLATASPAHPPDGSAPTSISDEAGVEPSMR
jgi:hypothetical protein